VVTQYIMENFAYFCKIMHCLTFSQVASTSQCSSMNHVVKSVGENVHTLLPYCSHC